MSEKYSDVTATQIMEARRDHARDGAMARLLHDLKEFMRAYPRNEQAEMPDHDLVWVDHILTCGAAKTIIDAINAHPELWADAIPEDVVIVPRALLKKITTLDDKAIDSLNDYGVYFVSRKAAILLHAKDEADRR